MSLAVATKRISSTNQRSQRKGNKESLREGEGGEFRLCSMYSVTVIFCMASTLLRCAASAAALLLPSCNSFVRYAHSLGCPLQSVRVKRFSSRTHMSAYAQATLRMGGHVLTFYARAPPILLKEYRPLAYPVRVTKTANRKPLTIGVHNATHRPEPSLRLHT